MNYKKLAQIVTSLKNYYTNLMLYGTIANLYKIPIFVSDMIRDEPYKSTPWSPADKQITSKSYPSWLLIHLGASVLQVGLTYALLKSTKKREATNIIDTLFGYFHYVFVTIVIVNSIHFLNMPFYWALLINLGPCIALELLLRYYKFCKSNNPLYWDTAYNGLYWYYVIITLPVLFQIITIVVKFRTFSSKIGGFFISA